MAKRHTEQNHKQALGQYFTSNADRVLSGFEHCVKDKHVVDPFAGAGDLLRWAHSNGAASVGGYDLEPQNSEYIQNDSIVNPPDYTGKIVVSNPPYLSKNKYKGDKAPFEQWQQDNLYKCHLASLVSADEFIEIIPTNFFCESRDAIRKTLFATHSIVSASFWTEAAFDDTKQMVTVIHGVRVKRNIQSFPLTFMPDRVTVNVELLPEHKYLHGKEFFEYLDTGNTVDLKVTKTDTGMPKPNSNIVIGILDKGSWRSGFSYNEHEPVYTKPSSFTTYQLTLSRTFTEAEQRAIVDLAQHKLESYRQRYNDMFLANYMGDYQKILSRDFLHRLLRAVVRELGYNKFEDELFEWN